MVKEKCYLSYQRQSILEHSKTDYLMVKTVNMTVVIILMKETLRWVKKVDLEL